MFAPTIHPPTLESWLNASRDPAVDAGVRALHTHIQEQADLARPVCTASGRCCDFARTGHDLFVTGLEVAWTLDRIPPARAIDAAAVDRASSAGCCPFLVRSKGAHEGLGVCGIHPARPSGCRVYFCDPTRERFVRDLAEHAAGGMRSLHDRFDIPYVYAEWRHLLRAFVSAGVAIEPMRPLPAPVDPLGAVMQVSISLRGA